MHMAGTFVLAAQNGIESVRTNAAADAGFVRKTAKDGSAYFVLMAKNGEIQQVNTRP